LCLALAALAIRVAPAAATRMAQDGGWPRGRRGDQVAARRSGSAAAWPQAARLLAAG